MTYDLRPWREFAERLRALANAIESPDTTIEQLARAADRCGMTLQIELIDNGRRDQVRAPVRAPELEEGAP